MGVLAQTHSSNMRLVGKPDVGAASKTRADRYDGPFQFAVLALKGRFHVTAAPHAAFASNTQNTPP